MPKKGYKPTETHKANVGKAMKGKKPWIFGKHHSEASKELISIRMTGVKRPFFSRIKWGTKKGISYTEEYKRDARKKYKYSMKKAGKLTMETIQKVYEENIKKFGTLTCYLCKNPISFEKENLEHKIPLSKGGTNDFENLGIACRKCNFSKHDKTEEEYLKIIERRQKSKE